MRAIDIFPRQIDHRAGAIELFRPRANSFSIPRHLCNFVCTRLGLARKHDNLISTLHQCVRQGGSDETASARQDNSVWVHGISKNTLARCGCASPTDSLAFSIVPYLVRLTMDLA